MDRIEDCPKHIGIIMDGNRRWATEKGLAAKDGHKKGADNLQDIARFAKEVGVKYLTVYAFSTENWRRSKEEIGSLMFLLRNYLADFSKKADTENIRIHVIGNLEELDADVQKSIYDSMERTKQNTGLILNIGFNYGGRAEIVKACTEIAEKIKLGQIEPEAITENLISSHMYTNGQPEPDLIIRTGGEYRTSNFLPWQSIYAEYYFPKVYWPAFSKEELIKAIEEFKTRKRNFGGV